MTASMYILLALAIIFANAPFVTHRWFGLVGLKQKHFLHHLLELLAGFALTAALAYLLESRAGSVHSQGWEFYAINLCLFAVFAFPGFVWRYFWQSKHRE